jgi:hypothetical protein
MRKLTILINAGEKTCAVKPGKWCRFMSQGDLTGQAPACTLFRDGGGSSRILRDEHGDVTGWLQRLPECIAAETMKVPQ